MSGQTDAGDSSALLDSILDDVAERVRAGETVSVDEYVSRFPQLAGELREMVPAFLLLENAGEERHRELRGPSALAPGQEFGEYQLIRELGRGGMGVVWEAEQTALKRRVALKLLPTNPSSHSSLTQRFEIEALAAARLKHPHIVPVYDVGEAS
ncbi:MAG: hypothetical protein AAF517_11565, partial [Planctomycetota bacterium]